jgi:hypothetical protein
MGFEILGDISDIETIATGKGRAGLTAASRWSWLTPCLRLAT